jgi:hypothetical protein
VGYTGIERDDKKVADRPLLDECQNVDAALPISCVGAVPVDLPFVAKMARSNFFKNYRVYMLTCVAYMGSLLFGTHYHGKAPNGTRTCADMMSVLNRI